MIPAGYMAKRVQKPQGFNLDCVTDVYSVGSCVNDNFLADYIRYWQHNSYWFFDSPDIIKRLARENSISLSETILFYYEVFEKEFDGTNWVVVYEAGSVSSVTQPSTKVLEGFDVVTFYGGSSPECSPLSCCAMAEELPTNVHCLFGSFDEAHDNVTNGIFTDSEPGPYRVFAVYSVPWPFSKQSSEAFKITNS